MADLKGLALELLKKRCKRRNDPEEMAESLGENGPAQINAAYEELRKAGLVGDPSHLSPNGLRHYSLTPEGIAWCDNNQCD